MDVRTNNMGLMSVRTDGRKTHIIMSTNKRLCLCGWRCSSMVERRSLTGELSLACTGPAAAGNHFYG